MPELDSASFNDLTVAMHHLVFNSFRQDVGSGSLPKDALIAQTMVLSALRQFLLFVPHHFVGIKPIQTPAPLFQGLRQLASILLNTG
jgi:hypothetical protein